MNKPIFGLAIGGLLGILDGLSAWFTPAVRAELLTIVIGSTFKGVVAGVVIGYFARKVNSLPVGILFGKNDQILDHAQHGVAMQAKIPGLVVTLVDGGHMLPLSAPELTARWITEFVNSRASLILKV